MPGTKTPLGESSSTSDLAVYTFPLNFGAASSTRKLLAFIGSRKASGGSTIASPSSVTIGGIAATKIIGAGIATSTSSGLSAWLADVPTGSSGDVVITFPTGQLRCGTVLYALTDVAFVHATAADIEMTTTAVTPLSFTIAVPNNGCLICATFLNNTATTATGGGLVQDLVNASTEGFRVASASVLSNAQTLTVLGADGLNQGNMPAMVGVSFEFAPDSNIIIPTLVATGTSR